MIPRSATLSEIPCQFICRKEQLARTIAVPSQHLSHKSQIQRWMPSDVQAHSHGAMGPRSPLRSALVGSIGSAASLRKVGPPGVSS